MVFAYLLETMNYAFALKLLGWDKIYCTRNFQVTPVTDGIYGPILDSAVGLKGVLAADYLPLLDPSTIKYEVEIDPVTQEMQSTPASFRLYGDESMIADVVQIRGAQAELDTNISAPTTPTTLASFNVKSRGNQFPSGFQYVQIGQETWKITSRSGNQFNYSQRACFGSIQEKSIVMPQNPVYVTPIEIGQAGRGAELWIQTIDQNGEVISLDTVWKGFVEYTRLTDNQYIEIVCRDALSYLKNNSANIHMVLPTTARSDGYDLSLVTWQLEKDIHTQDNRPITFPVLESNSTTLAEYYTKVNCSGGQYLRKIFESVNDHLITHGGAWLDDDARKYRDNSTSSKFIQSFLTKKSITDWDKGSKMAVWIGDGRVEEKEELTPEGPIDTNYYGISFEKEKSKFKTVQMLKESTSSTQNRFFCVNNPFNDALMDYVYGGPQGTLDTALKSNIMKTEAQIPDAIKIYEDIDTVHVWMKLRGKYPPTNTPGTRCVVSGVVTMDTISYVLESRANAILDTEQGLSWEYGSLVESNHYISGLYHGYWTNYSRFFVDDISDKCAAVVMPISTWTPLFRRFDIPSNTKTLGEELADNMKFFDYYFTYDAAGDITVRNFADDLSNTETFTSIGSNDLLEKPEFSQDSALVNQVVIKSNGFLNENGVKSITDYASIKKYGGKKAKEIDLTGTILELRYFSDQESFDNILMNRYLRRFSGIRNIVVVKVPITFHTTVIGQTIQLTDWITPNQSGVIGGSGEFYTVIKKEVDWSEAVVTLTLILFPFYTFEEGNIVPCARVEYFDGVNVYLANDVMDTAGTMQDYSWSDDTAYPYTSGDRGVGWFSAGYKVVLTDRSSSVWYSEEFTVASVDPATFKVTLTSTPGSYWTDAIDNGLPVDIHYSVADNVVTAQYPFTYIGDSSTGYVDTGLVNPNKKWRAS